MSIPDTLKDIYIAELKDAWSANDQMQRALTKIIPKATDLTLQAMLATSQSGIFRHTNVLKDLIAEAGEALSRDHCRAMEGVVSEATKQIFDDGPAPGPLLDVIIIAQYQRMTHYGIAGFGTAAAYAKALGLDDDHRRLGETTGEIYGSDEYMTKLAETSVNLRARSS